MTVNKLLAATAFTFALSPLTAFAESDISAMEQAWLESLQSNNSVAEGRADADSIVVLGDQHPVEVQQPEVSTTTREEVKRELAEFGAARVEA